ncbi:hypothetical protein ABH926_006821 [Catenulispora sp. GP43]|uniref:hypothetical protein n=1 Tax=Catenulispora sp. GP43 TaxID=3156263 RepID=UPI00351169E4
MNADLPPEARRRLAELHRRTTEPLVAAVRDLGVPEPDLTARLLGGLLSAAMAAVEPGADPRQTGERVKALIGGPVTHAPHPSVCGKYSANNYPDPCPIPDNTL